MTSSPSGSLIEIAVESWRFSRVFLRLVSKLNPSEQPRYESQLRWYLKRLQENLEAAGLKLVDVEGQNFDSGMAATAINGSDFAPDDKVFVDQMVEPILLGQSGVVRTGTVMLRKALE